jgi:hypothetical protein
MYNNLMMNRKGNEMLKFERAASVGDIIRAYDFKPMYGRPDCYVEGKVVEVHDGSQTGYKAFKIECINDFFDGKFRKGARSSRVGKTVFVPMEVSFMEYDGRVLNLSK